MRSNANVSHISNAYQGCDFRRAMVIAEQLSAMGLHLQIRRSRISGRIAPLPACETLADRFSIRKVDHQFAAALLRERLRDKFSGLSGREVAELAPAVISHDPVVETVVRPDVNDCRRHGLSSQCGSAVATLAPKARLER
jgi:hypothetical protein